MSECAAIQECGFNTTVHIDLLLGHDGYYWTLEGSSWEVRIYGAFCNFAAKGSELAAVVEQCRQQVREWTGGLVPGTLGHEWRTLCLSGLDAAENEARGYWEDRCRDWECPARIVLEVQP